MTNDPGTSKFLRQVVCEHRNESLSYSTAHHAIEAIGLHSYRVHIVHELLPLNYDRCVTYCQWLLNFIQTSPCMLNDAFYSDEAWFQLSEYVNSPALANLKTLKANIKYEINKISRIMLMNVARNVVRRVRACISAAGGQFKHLL